jgi:Flp pilus assembly pilin Flp
VLRSAESYQTHQSTSRFASLEVFARKIPRIGLPRRQAWFEQEGETMMRIASNLWHEDQGQDIAEYAVMLAVILVIVVGTIRLVGSNANNVFSSVGSAIQ